MALVIVSSGALADSRLHTVRVGTLVAALGALTMLGLLGSLALGFHLGSASQIGEGAAGLPVLDPARPGNRALIDQIGALSGRLIRLEAEASRLAGRIGASLAKPPRRSGPTIAAVNQPAGGPLLEPQFGAAPGYGVSLFELDRNLADVEASLDMVAARVERLDLDRMAFPSRAPIPGAEISSGFGPRIDPFTGRPARHTGFDYPAPYGTPILASAGGRVRYAGPHGSYGKTVEIDHGEGLVSRYGHLSQILVRVGDILLPGQQIATVGSTGRSTGPHLHFEILRDGTAVQPGPYLASGDS
jgi:murein DD-endopeptidase MepM/ murein hydrolase activator NlpD